MVTTRVRERGLFHVHGDGAGLGCAGGVRGGGAGERMLVDRELSNQCEGFHF